MASNIDASKPVGPIAYTADMRGNFASAKSEIEALQQDIATLESGMQNPTLRASSALEGSHLFRNAAADLYSVRVTGLSDYGWLLIIDAAAIPGDGPVTPVAAIQATTQAGVSIDFGGAAATLVNGLVAVLSTTGPFTKTAGPTGFFSALYR